MKSELAVVLITAVVAVSLLALAKRPAARPAPDPATDALLAEVNQHFTAAGKPIHPKLIWEFSGWKSDAEPITLKVDLTQSLGTNEYGEDEVNARDSKLSDNGQLVEWKHGKFSEPAHYENFIYRHVGRLTDGTHVLFTRENTGGSGWFEQVSFVTATAEPVGDTGRWRVALETRGTFPAGDRSDARVRIEGDHVLLGPSRPDVPEPHRMQGQRVVRPW